MAVQQTLSAQKNKRMQAMTPHVHLCSKATSLSSSPPPPPPPLPRALKDSADSRDATLWCVDMAHLL